MKEYVETNVEVQGHTDRKASESYNQKLSEQGAFNFSYLIGVRPIDLKTPIEILQTSFVAFLILKLLHFSFAIVDFINCFIFYVF